jgi:hypothetical protein
MSEKPLRAADDSEGAYRLVIARAYEEEGCELLVFGRGKRGAFHLRGGHSKIPVRDARDVPLQRGQWRALVDYVEAKRLWDARDAEPAAVMDGVAHSFEASGPALHAFSASFGSVPDARIAAVRSFVIATCAAAARALSPSAPSGGEDPGRSERRAPARRT